MTSEVKPIPEDYYTATPYLIVSEPAKAIEFYKKALGATELMRLTDAEGKIRHAEIKIGDSPIMLAGEFPEFPEMRSPQTLGGSPVHLYLYVEDVDRLAAQAVATGARVLMPVQDQNEDRRGGLVDPFGHVWWVASRIENLSREEIQRRFEAMR